MEKSGFVLLALLFFITTTFAQKGKRDVIYLKNGSIINGQIISQLPSGQIKIKTRDNSLWVFESSGIDSISHNTKISGQIHPGFFNLTEAGVLTGNSGNKDKSPFNMMNISGWKFKNRFSVGGGAGIEFESETYLPVIADIRYYLKRQGVNPFFGIQGGYSFALDKPDNLYSDPRILSSPGYRSDLKMTAKGGFLLNPAVGICTSLNGNLALTLSAGYRMMRHRYCRTDDYKIDIDYNRLSVKIGLLIQ